MFSLLNRFAWCIALLIGIGGSILIEWELFIVGGVVALLIKRLLLGADFIREALESSHIVAGEQSTTSKSAINSEPQVAQEQKVMGTILGSIIHSESQIAQGQKEIPNVDPHIPVDAAIVRENTIHHTPHTEIVKEPSFIAKFFAENALAKIGGILLFLGVLFFLSLIWAALGSVGRILIGFIFAAILYGIGILLEHKKLHWEGRILMGTALLTSYAVILTARFLFGTTEAPFLSEGITFIFLVLNTALAITTGLVYSSTAFVLFSVAFAFVVPFLIGGSFQSPYLLLGYVTLVAISGGILAIRESSQTVALWIARISITGGLIVSVLSVASVHSNIALIAVIINTVIIALLSVYMGSRMRHPLFCVFSLGGSFIALFLVLFSSSLGASRILFVDVFVLPCIIIAPMILLGATGYLFKRSSYIVDANASLLLAPLLIFIGLLFLGWTSPLQIIALLIVATFSSLIAFVYLGALITVGFQSIFLGSLAVFLFIVSGVIRFDLIGSGEILPLSVLIASSVSALIFYGFCMFYALRRYVSQLWTIGTLGVICILAPLLQNTGSGMVVSLCALAGFVYGHFFGPFFNRESALKDIRAFSLSLVLGALFLSGSLYFFGEKHFPGVAMGIAYLALAIGYVVYAALMVGLKTFVQSRITEPKYNLLLIVLAVALSLGTLAIALLFSPYPGIVSAAWVFESVVVLLVFTRIIDNRLFAASLVLMFIWGIKLASVLWEVTSWSYTFLVPTALIALALFIGMRLIGQENTSKLRSIYDGMHMLGMILVLITLVRIIPSTGEGWSTFSIALTLIPFAWIYAQWGNRALQSFFVVIVTLAGWLQIMKFPGVISMIEHGRYIGWDDLTQTSIIAAVSPWVRLLQYGSTLAMLAISWIFARPLATSVQKALAGSTAVYLFIITSQYVYDSFSTTFAVTIWWAVISTVLLLAGIHREQKILRTIGLYIGTLTLAKILLYDIWTGIDSGIVRVIALMVTGALMMWISSLYSKRFADNMRGEFSWKSDTEDGK